MKKIGIRFPDIDFMNTLRPFMEQLSISLIEGPWEPTKAQIVQIFNEMAFGLYLLHQFRFRYNDDLKSTKNYLQIEERHIFFDEEVDKYFSDCNGRDNGEFHILDLQTPGRPYIYLI